mmetsp:Transcript_4300/g.11132  ORF Transcript_4300/g.11132 Transcript_4300/m.11132 type:complete len:553 (-) Transcript_4300:80-1738(-)
MLAPTAIPARVATPAEFCRLLVASRDKNNASVPALPSLSSLAMRPPASPLRASSPVSSHSSSAISPPSSPGTLSPTSLRALNGTPIGRGELLAMIDLVLSKSGLGPDSTEQDVARELGEPGIKLVMACYAAALGHGHTQLPGEISLPEPADTAYKADTEIAVSRIFELGKVAPVADPTVSPWEPYTGPRVVTMTGFGELGRWGNQVLQYAFLVMLKNEIDAEEIQVPHWVGKDLFELEDRPVQRALPAVVEGSEMKANSTFTDDFLSYIKASNEGHDVPEIAPHQFSEFSQDELVEQYANKDIWGWFQWPTHNFKKHEALLRKTFTPAAGLKEHFEREIAAKLSCNGIRTVVGLHLRLGDYKNIAASSFGYCAPTSWYLEWLAEIWPTLKNPVLFVASDEIDTVLRDFAAYNPVTSDSLGLEIPHEYSHLKAGFFPDWYTLQFCDVLAISNSTFSFSSCLLNNRPGARFFRAHYKDKIVEIDPWNADPIVHRPDISNPLARAYDTLQVLYNTQGASGVVKNLLYEMPYYAVRNVVMKMVLQSRGKQQKLLKA